MRCYPHFILPVRSSRGFASTAGNHKVALFRLAFAMAPQQNCLTKLPTVSRRIIMQKARRQAFPRSRQHTVDSRQQSTGLCRSPRPLGRQAPTHPAGAACAVPKRMLSTAGGLPLGHSPPTACKRVVSGSVSSPGRGSSHRSLALLVHYRSPEST
jgi:hypothetical protein